MNLFRREVFQRLWAFRVARSIVLVPSVLSVFGLLVMSGVEAMEMWCCLLVIRTHVFCVVFLGVDRFGFAVGACGVVVGDDVAEFNGDVVGSERCRPAVFNVFGGGRLVRVVNGDVVV